MHAAGVVAMAVRQQQRVDFSNLADVGQPARLRAEPEIEQQAHAAGFDQEAGRALAANA